MTVSSISAVLSYLVALCGFVPLYPYIGTAPRLVFAAGLAMAVYQDRRGSRPLKNWMLNIAIVPVFLYYAVQFSRHNPIQPVVSVLVIMLAVRLCSEKSARHYLQVHAISLFCLASSSLFDLSPRFLMYLFAILLMVALSLVLLTFQFQENCPPVSSKVLHKIVTAGLIIPLVSVPLLLLFFPILPRTQLPLWRFLQAPEARPSGFAENVEPGISAAVGETRRIAFRAESLRISQNRLYWRGAVFNRLDGRRWVRDTGLPPELAVPSDERIPQTIFMEPGLARFLLALDVPVKMTPFRGKRAADQTFELPGVSGRRLIYRVESANEGTLPVSGGIQRAFYLQLPGNPALPGALQDRRAQRKSISGGISSRMKMLADEVRSSGTDDAARLEYLSTFYRKGGYSYSLTGLPTGDNAVDQFLFEKKIGHCEFFASSFAIILRAAGVPARIVGGYLGGEYNELGGYYLVTEEMAHVWVEAYIEGRGWLRVDPSAFARNAGEIWNSRPERPLGLRLRLALDSLDHYWNRAVITYDFEQQLEAAYKAGQRLKGLDPLGMLKGMAPFVAAGGVLAGLLMVWVRRGRLFLSREERLLRSFFRRVESDCGVRIEAGRQGLFEVAEITGSSGVRDFVDIYAGAVYRDRRLTDDEAQQLRRLLAAGF